MVRGGTAGEIRKKRQWRDAGQHTGYRAMWRAPPASARFHGAACRIGRVSPCCGALALRYLWVRPAPLAVSSLVASRPGRRRPRGLESPCPRAVPVARHASTTTRALAC